MIFTAGFIVLFLLLWLFFIPAGPVIQHALALLGKKTASFRYNDYVPVVVLLATGLAASAAAGDQFLDLAELVQARSEVLQSIDTGIHEWARQQRSPAATFFFTAFTHLGSPVALSILVIGVAAMLALRGRYRWGAYLIFTTAIGALLVAGLKLFFLRARPDLAAALRSAQGYSFPSGHAMGSAIVFGAFSYLIIRSHRPWRVRAAGLAAAVSVIAAISSSRVYLGVHWISDIGAGLAGGSLWVLVTTVAYESFRRIRMIRSLRRQRRLAGD